MVADSLPDQPSLMQLARRAFASPASLGTIAIILVCMVDLFLTLVVVLLGIAVEANPVLAWSFEFGPVCFALVKTASFIPGVCALEMCRIRNASFASWAARFAVYSYFAVYLVGSLKLHQVV